MENLKMVFKVLGVLLFGYLTIMFIAVVGGAIIDFVASNKFIVFILVVVAICVVVNVFSDEKADNKNE